jgi:hypothetical protein
MRCMRIVIATAEPRGAYHLTPLANALKESLDEFVHLVPYPEPVQGEAIMDVTINTQEQSRVFIYTQ